MVIGVVGGRRERVPVREPFMCQYSTCVFVGMQFDRTGDSCWRPCLTHSATAQGHTHTSMSARTHTQFPAAHSDLHLVLVGVEIEGGLLWFSGGS